MRRRTAIGSRRSGDGGGPLTRRRRAIDRVCVLRPNRRGVAPASGNPNYRINIKDLQVLEKLGEGQYGVVTKVLYKPTNTVMALKVGVFVRGFVGVRACAHGRP